MTNPQTVSESFIKWMEDNQYGTFGTTIFLNQIPDDAPDDAYWVVTAGGDVTQNMVTRESIQQFSTQVFYRNKLGEVVEHNLFDLNQEVNGRRILEIAGFDLHSIEATMPEDNDRDVENRRQGSLVVSTQIYVS